MSATRFRDQAIAFSDGAKGRTIEFETADPLNFFEAISSPEKMRRTVIDGKLFLPRGAGAPVGAVIVVPGSLGVAVSHLAHAEAITGLGLAAFVIDPFGARGVTSTVSNQAQYSFAASGYDVRAAVKAIAALPEIDSRRIGAQGHSRGGSAVLTAAARRFADPVMQDRTRLAAVYAAYPWCGQQFLDPDIGATKVRAIIGDRDEWCLPQQVQGCIQSMRVRGGDASLRIVDGAQHSFDRETPVEKIETASVSPGAPTCYIADDGALIHPLRTAPDPGLTDRDIMIYAVKSGYGIRGARIGSAPGQPALFREDMLAFWKSAL